MTNAKIARVIGTGADKAFSLARAAFGGMSVCQRAVRGMLVVDDHARSLHSFLMCA